MPNTRLATDRFGIALHDHFHIGRCCFRMPTGTPELLRTVEVVVVGCTHVGVLPWVLEVDVLPLSWWSASAVNTGEFKCIGLTLLVEACEVGEVRSSSGTVVVLLTVPCKGTAVGDTLLE